MPDLPASGPDPGTTYTVTGSIPGVYHEDRVVVTEVLPSTYVTQMFRVYGASFATGTWQYVGSVSTAYATVQNPDGSIHYLTYSGTTGWSTDAWQGSGNNNVYSAVDYGLSTTDPSLGVNNTAALQAAVGAAIAAGGGTVFIPQGSYKLYGPVQIASSGTAGVIIAGVSGITELVQTAAYDIFDVSNNGHGYGIRFRDLRFRYQQPTSLGLFAVNVMGSDSVTCERVYFKDCPGSFQTDDNCEFCGLFDCWVDYAATIEGGGPLNGQTMVSLSGSEDFVAQCVIFQSGSATDCIAISLLGNNNAHFISNTHIADIYTGISITGGDTEGLNGVYVSEVLINTLQNAVIIEPAVAGHTIHDIHFADCTFAATNDSGMQTSGVQISIPSGGSATDVACIYFTGCSAYGWGHAGIEIDAGENIVINGGQYSSNGQNAPTDQSYLGAGIAVLGGSQVTISGADCSGVNQLWEALAPGPPPPPSQLYGISIYPLLGGSLSDVTVSGCNLNANENSGVLVSGATTFPSNVFVRGCDASQFSSYATAITVGAGVTHAQNLQITDCSGYNDYAAEIVSPTHVPSGPFYNTTYAYYGPVVFYVWGTGANSVTIGSLTTGLGNGSYNLPCNVAASIGVSVGAPNFAMIGM